MTKASPQSSVFETIDGLQETVRERDLEVFALIDHSDAAACKSDSRCTGQSS